MEWVRGEVIGRGSFGTVNLAILPKQNTNQSSIVVKSSNVYSSSSLKNERDVLTELGNRSRNIIQYFGDSVSDEAGGRFYNLFLEYACNGSLADYLRKSEGRFGDSEVVKKCVRGVLSGLCHVHDSGFVHSDIKLQNILVFDDGEAKLADFGLARKIGESNSVCQLRGTPLYMSPEVVAGGKVVTPAADVWAVGCAVVEMVTGKPAWEFSPESDVSGLLYRIGVRGECPKIPGNLCDDGKDFLSKCFLKDPNERWTARMLLDHPFLSECGNRDQFEKPSVSPKCPFEFPDWESTEHSSFGSGSIESLNSDISFSLESHNSRWTTISSRFEGEFGNGRVPNWSDSNGWITIR